MRRPCGVAHFLINLRAYLWKLLYISMEATGYLFLRFEMEAPELLDTDAGAAILHSIEEPELAEAEPVAAAKSSASRLAPDELESFTISAFPSTSIEEPDEASAQRDFANADTSMEAPEEATSLTSGAVTEGASKEAPDEAETFSISVIVTGEATATELPAERSKFLTPFA